MVKLTISLLQSLLIGFICVSTGYCQQCWRGFFNTFIHLQSLTCTTSSKIFCLTVYLYLFRFVQKRVDLKKAFLCFCL